MTSYFRYVLAKIFIWYEISSLQLDLYVDSIIFIIVYKKITSYIYTRNFSQNKICFILDRLENFEKYRKRTEIQP